MSLSKALIKTNDPNRVTNGVLVFLEVNLPPRLTEPLVAALYDHDTTCKSTLMWPSSHLDNICTAKEPLLILDRN